MNASKKTQQAGFSLVEIAVVLAILGIIIGAGFSTLGAHIDNANQRHTMGNLEITKRAMLDYVKVNKHLPCPDTDNDGEENRTSNACANDTGTVPFNDIGLGVGLTSDDYGNVFAYGINSDATALVNMRNKANSASYFSNVSNTDGDYPAFRLTTPPTASDPDPSVPGISGSYTVCKKHAAGCSVDNANYIEVNSIPVVIVAFNENGGGTSLTSCGSGVTTTKEVENCNGNKLLWKSVFDRYDYDDQMVTISGYEIKQQVDLVEFTVNINNDYGNYDVIIMGEVDSANDLNVATGENNKFLIANKVNDEGLLIEAGNLDANVQLKDGEDVLKIEGNIKADGNADMGTGNDELIVIGTILLRGQATLGDGDDTSTIGGAVIGQLDAGFGNDTVTIQGDVTGSVLMSKGDDHLYLYGDLAGGTLDGGNDSDTLYTTKTAEEWAQMLTDYHGTVTGFETIKYAGEW